ncbi:MAG TPA: hypothetical protein VKI65_10490 [Gemmataceae bacterium]|nr:hypothetical protein [Gemmataceae bacterium]
MQEPAADYLGAQAAAVAETVFDTGLCEHFQMIARLAQAETAQAHVADGEFAPDEVVERYATGKQVAPRLPRRQRDPVFSAQGFESFQRNERHFLIGFRNRLLAAVTVADKATSRRRFHGLDAVKFNTLSIGDVNPLQSTIDHRFLAL